MILGCESVGPPRLNSLGEGARLQGKARDGVTLLGHSLLKRVHHLDLEGFESADLLLALFLL